jgi:hypothetical protein
MFSTVIAGIWPAVIVMGAHGGIIAGIAFLSGIDFELKQVDGRWIKLIYQEPHLILFVSYSGMSGFF